MMEWALELDAGRAPDAVGKLVGLAEGSRSPLEAAQALLIARLHRRSNDFAATGALGSVGAALDRIGWVMRSLPVRRRWTGRRP